MRFPFLASWIWITACICLVLIVSGGILPAASFPDISALPVQTNLPSPLVMLDGTPVTTKRQWTRKRLPELKALFQYYMYGFLPPPPAARIKFSVEREDKKLFGGKATLKEVTIRFGATNVPAIHLLLVVPNHRTKPAPVFVGLNFFGNHTVLNDPAIRLPTGWMPDKAPGATNNHATDAGRGKEANVWAIEQSIDRGYAVATFYNGDIEPDRTNAMEGIRRNYPEVAGTNLSAQAWGTLAAWAWGLHRAVDYLVTDKDIDRKRIAIFGHSRNGKAALLAAVFDERVAMVIPHQAGCGGTAPSRARQPDKFETVRQINDRFPHWFDGEFKKFNDQPERLPFDQNCLMAMMSPRPLLLSNGADDTRRDLPGQFEMLKSAEVVYQLLNAGNLAADQMPETGRLVDSKLGFFIRAGKHSTTTEDWKAFLDYADAQWGKPR